MNNCIHQVRPKSTFDSYDPQTQEQIQARDTLRQMAAEIKELKMPKRDMGRPPMVMTPFTDGYFWVLTGKPGVGKTHLMEALVNELRHTDSWDGVFIKRGSIDHFGCLGVVSASEFDYRPIVIIDDAFSDVDSLQQIDGIKVKAISNLLTFAYEQRILLMMTTNFPFLNGILPLIAQHDNKIGRITSRCEELLSARAGEICIEGPDYRKILAKKASNSRQGLRLFTQ